MDLAFNGRLAVVTGADSGIGLRTAITLASEGAKVIISDLEEDALQDAVEKIKGEVQGAEVSYVAADLTNLDDVNKLQQKADEQGGAAVLAHLAGTRGAAGDFLELTDDGWLENLKR